MLRDELCTVLLQCVHKSQVNKGNIVVLKVSDNDKYHHALFSLDMIHFLDPEGRTTFFHAGNLCLHPLCPALKTGFI